MTFPTLSQLVWTQGSGVTSIMLVLGISYQWPGCMSAQSNAWAEAGVPMLYIEKAMASSMEKADAIRRAVSETHEVALHEVLLLQPGGLPRTSSGKVRRRAVAALLGPIRSDLIHGGRAGMPAPLAQ